MTRPNFEHWKIIADRGQFFRARSIFLSEFGSYCVKVVLELIFVNPNCLPLQAFDSREGSTQSDCSITMSLRPLKKVFVTQAFFQTSIYMMLQVF